MGDVVNITPPNTIYWKTSRAPILNWLGQIAPANYTKQPLVHFLFKIPVLNGFLTSEININFISGAVGEVPNVSRRLIKVCALVAPTYGLRSVWEPREGGCGGGGSQCDI